MEGCIIEFRGDCGDYWFCVTHTSWFQATYQGMPMCPVGHETTRADHYERRAEQMQQERDELRTFLRDWVCSDAHHSTRCAFVNHGGACSCPVGAAQELLATSGDLECIVCARKFQLKDAEFRLCCSQTCEAEWRRRHRL